MSKSIIVALAFGLALATPVLAHDMGGMKMGGMKMGDESGKTTTVKGEIVDLACFMGHGAKGAKHAHCAKGCIAGGAPMGLLEANGNIVLLVNDHEKEDAFKAAQKLGGEAATVTGHLVKKGGLTALVVESAVKGGAGK